MSLLPLLSFSSGELDPVLHDNVTLEKFKKGLHTARNVMISKTGTIQSRFSRQHVVKSKNDAEAIKVYWVPNTNYFLEFGPLYVRVYTLVFNATSSFQSPTLYATLTTTYTAANVENLHFATSKGHVYIFCSGVKTRKLFLSFGSSAFVSDANIFLVPNPITSIAVTSAGAGAGYPVEYLATLVVNGEETLSKDTSTTSPFFWPKPVASGDSNDLLVTWPTASVDFASVNACRIYSRPYNGGAWGLLGTTTTFDTSGSNKRAYFRDIGQLPDYTNGVQDLITKEGLSASTILNLFGKTGGVYQQRLIVTSNTDKEALVASRPGFQNNFYRDYPYAADSALLFKSGTSGSANVLRILESDGLIVFTTNGVYISTGLLSVNNLALERKGSWVINEDIPPLVVPGGVFFVDDSNTIRQLIFSQDILSYESIEQTIFSNHLFTNRTITSWSYQNGVVPLIIVCLSDGTFATFTYNFEQQMRAWTRHDSVYPIEQVEGTTQRDVTLFVVNKDGNRYIECSIPRFVPVEVQATYQEADMLSPTAFMDSIKSNFVAFEDTNTLTPVVADTWNGSLVWTQNGALPSFSVGDIVRWFHPIDKNYIDLEITSVTTPGLTYVVTPSEEFPSDYGTPENLTFYLTYTEITGLTHLEGESVSVMCDGAIVTSPLNDVEGYPTLTVTGGEITLPERAAIIHVGRPIVADIKTLNVTTVEQSPTLLESVNVNKLYVRVRDTRGLYCSNEFPENATGGVDGSSVEGMEDMDLQYVPKDGQIIGNTYPKPVSTRIEKSLPGGWDSQGQIAFRQVDPYHFEIMSIIPDLTVLSRNERRER